ncbi:hypothetical protein PP175_12535 [Aneurinibacillus sp. Ricciae_BoGa-3]|uniref:hypothetical protein n=1 Tax=Aneurinibacillus sp. Ricciae_BoGa-3 TaxID=3022697 RepID=UPI00234000DA|nr:hypothetical protein [Aneurinibacillus sp. Ricciae_BoGa-3]WCK56665.1 hypothetical protein PP175_12535 [Aneurinibacillus sp. Ricciae_BoGa-3]
MKRLAAALLSLTLPGIGQMYNDQLLKGLIFILIESVINIYGHLNQAIYLDFRGFHREAVQTINFQYALFYPPFYTYVVWDAFFHAEPNGHPYSIFIFIISGFIGTLVAIFGSLSFDAKAITIGISMIIPMITGIFIYKNKTIASSKT